MRWARQQVNGQRREAYRDLVNEDDVINGSMLNFWAKNMTRQVSTSDST
jgi:hypothetical protein